MSEPTKKPIRFSNHAYFEMKRRRILPIEVVRVIRKPGQILPSTKGRKVFQDFLGRKRHLLLRVIVAEHARSYHVVTAYKTSQIKKYWRQP